VDVDADPLVGLLGGRAKLDGRRYPLALFADGSILEGPERFMLTRYVRGMPGGTPSPVPPEDGRAYAETARFKQQLAGRVGLPTRPTRDIYDVVILGAGPAGLRALGSRTTRASRRGSAGRSSRRESMRRQPDSGRRF
jgi:thioredoxin reductase (NADPH)